MTSQPWSWPSTSTSNCTNSAAKVLPTAYLSCFRYFYNDNLMMSQNSITTPAIQQVVDREIQDVATTRVRTRSAHTHGLDRHVPPAAFPTATTTARPSLSRTGRNTRGLPRALCQSACGNPHPQCPLQSHLESWPNQRGCLGSIYLLLVLQFRPRTEAHNPPNDHIRVTSSLFHTFSTSHTSFLLPLFFCHLSYLHLNHRREESIWTMDLEHAYNVKASAIL